MMKGHSRLPQQKREDNGSTSSLQVWTQQIISQIKKRHLQIQDFKTMAHRM